MGIPVAAAIAVGLISSFIQSLGLTIQRKSHVQDGLKPLDQRKRAVQRPLWIAGFAVYISSNIFGSVFQIGALPIVVLAPLGGVSLLWNSLLAHVLLGEGFTQAMMLGTFLVATGAVLIAIFGVVPDQTHSLDELLDLWARPPFVAFFSAVCVSISIVLIVAHVFSWRVAQVDRAFPASALQVPNEVETPPSSRPSSNYASPCDPAAIPFRSTHHERRRSTSSDLSQRHQDAKMVRFAYVPESESGAPLGISLIPACQTEMEEAQDRTLTLIGLAFAAASGTLSGLCLVLAKAAVELVISTFDYWRTGRGENEFGRVQTWLLVAGLALAAVLQLVYLNYSLTFASPALICPLAFCFFNLASIFDGLVFYDQFGRLAPHQITLVSIGVAVLLVGVWVVSAIQPTGQGGVELGTWVEEEAIAEEEALSDHEPRDELEAGEGATLVTPDGFTQEPGQLEEPGRSPRLDTSFLSEPPILQAPISPRSPMSPTFSRARHRHRVPRYGTLIPELAPPGAPTGFAFGIGVASPGFALRSNSISLGSGAASGSPTIAFRRGRSRSEDTHNAAGILATGSALDRSAAMSESGIGVEAVVSAQDEHEDILEQTLEHGGEFGQEQRRRESWIPQWWWSQGGVKLR